MRILLINQTFHPDVAATAQLGFDLARHLAREGHSVSVITSRSIYGLQGAALPPQELIDGVRIHRVGQSLFGKASMALRLLDFLLFYVLATFKAFTIRRADVVIPFTTPPFIVLLGVMLRWLRGSKCVYWLMDLYPDVPIAAGALRAGSVPARFFEALHRWCMRQCARVVVLGRCMRQRIVQKGISPQRIAMINVWADTDELIPAPRGTNELRRELGINEREFVVMYSGNLGLGHDAQTICQTLLELRERDDIRFVFIGGGKRMAVVERFARENALSRVVFLPYQLRERLSTSLSAGDLHLMTVSREMTGLLVPSKLYGALAVQRPIAFIGPRESEVAQVVLESNCGIVVESGQSPELAKQIIELAQNPQTARAMGQRARQSLATAHDRRHACAKWSELLRQTTASTGGSRGSQPRRPLP